MVEKFSKRAYIWSSSLTDEAAASCDAFRSTHLTVHTDELFPKVSTRISASQSGSQVFMSLGLYERTSCLQCAYSMPCPFPDVHFEEAGCYSWTQILFKGSQGLFQHEPNTETAAGYDKLGSLTIAQRDQMR